MPLYTIETTYHLPVYRHCTYEAASADEACELAIDDDDWWNAADHGGFDIADLFAIDAEIGRDMATVFSYLVDRPTAEYPEAHRVEIEAVVRRWRPEVWKRYAESA